MSLSALKKLSLSVVVPALNEQNNIVPTLETLEQALQKSVEDYEIIVINDGSTDRTGELAQEYANSHQDVRIISNQKNIGLGSSYKRGIQEATKDLYVYIPADNTWPYESLLELFGSIGKGDVITSYASNPESRHFLRRIVSYLYTLTMNILFCQKMKYFNGLTIYPVNTLRTINIQSTGFGFQAEILLKTIFQKLSVIELCLPIDDRTAGSSKAVNLKNIISVLCTITGLFFQLRVFKTKLNKKAVHLSVNGSIIKD